jgi:hypothetical protein
MASPGLEMPRAIDVCLLGQLTTFCFSLILRAIYDTPSIVDGTHGVPSMLHANDDMRTRFSVEKSMIGITASPLEVRPPGLNRHQLQWAAQPGDARGTTSTTPLPGTDTTTVDRKTCVEYRRLHHISGLFSGPLTSRSPMSTSTSPRRTREAGWPSIPSLPAPLGQLNM